MKFFSFFLLITLSLLACDHRNKNVDKFYTEKSDWDLIRFPLIKPYHVVTLPPDTNWFVQVMDTDTTHLFPSIPGTRSINVLDTMIIAYAKNTLLGGQKVGEAWFVVNPKNDSVRGFKDQQKYFEYLKSIKIINPKLYPVRDVFQYFYDQDTLDWKKFNRQH